MAPIGGVRAGYLSAGKDTIPDSRIEDWEDGDTTISLKNNWSGWSGDTANLSAQQTVALAGSWSGAFTAPDSGIASVTATRDTSDAPSKVSMLMQVDKQTGTFTSSFYRLRNGTDQILEMSLEDDGAFAVNGTELSATWSVDTTYLVSVFNIDWTAETADYEFVRSSDGVVIASGSESFVSSVSSMDNIIVFVRDSNSNPQTLYFDNVDFVQ